MEGLNLEILWTGVQDNAAEALKKLAAELSYDMPGDIIAVPEDSTRFPVFEYNDSNIGAVINRVKPEPANMIAVDHGTSELLINGSNGVSFLLRSWKPGTTAKKRDRILQDFGIELVINPFAKIDAVTDKLGWKALQLQLSGGAK